MDDVDILEAQNYLYDRKLFSYCDNSLIGRVDVHGNLWMLAFEGVGSISIGLGMPLETVSGAILTGLGSVTPVGWIVKGKHKMGFMLTEEQLMEAKNNCVDQTVMIDGFVFTFDTYGRTYMIIHQIPEARLYGVVACSRRSLEEHILFINEKQVENVEICAKNIDFIEKCPGLKSILVVPADCCGNGFDYSPLYRLKNIEELDCTTEYGYDGVRCRYSTTIDYSKIKGIRRLNLADYAGALNYQTILTLEGLYMCEYPKENLKGCSESQNLKYICLERGDLKTLAGVEKSKTLEWVSLVNLRKLKDISNLKYLKDTITALNIEGCPKVLDFSILEQFTNLEHLQLMGSNKLENLQFLKKMKNLKTFVFDMKINDGDLTLCLDIPYVYCRKSYRYYNVNSKRLPANSEYEIWGQDFRYYLN